MYRSIILTAALFATPALAEFVPSEATFATGTSAPARIVINDTIWRCDGAKCAGKNETRAVMVRLACKTLAGEVGALSSFAVGTQVLGETELAACNEKARAAK